MNKLNAPQRKSRSLVIAAGALAVVTLLGACNTFEGMVATPSALARPSRTRPSR